MSATMDRRMRRFIGSAAGSLARTLAPCLRRTELRLAGLAIAALFVHGYHAGFQDQAIYLPAIKLHLDPSLYPHDRDLFTAQARLTFFDEAVAHVDSLSKQRLESVLFGLHLITTFALLLGAWRIASWCFERSAARWGAVALVAALSPIPVAGTLLRIDEAYLHPRRVATAALLLALSDLLVRRRCAAAGWMMLAAMMHVQMAAYGLFHILVLVWPRQTGRFLRLGNATLAAAPLSRWQELIDQRRHLFPTKWRPAEWAGVLLPVLLSWRIACVAERNGEPRAARWARRLVASILLAVCAGIVIGQLAPGRATLADPMRALHFAYILLALIGGGLLGQLHLRRSLVRWSLVFVPMCGIALATARWTLPASPHIEWPARLSANPWLQAFAWAREHTPRDATFALDPEYLRLPGADFHDFRSTAERSMLADAVKDRGAALYAPPLAERVDREIRARMRWVSLGRDDFLRLKRDQGVDWVVVHRAQRVILPCPYENALVKVCRIDGIP